MNCDEDEGCRACRENADSGGTSEAEIFTESLKGRFGAVCTEAMTAQEDMDRLTNIAPEYGMVITDALEGPAS